MGERIKASQLSGVIPAVRMAYRIAYPEGLTLQEMSESPLGWIQAIYRILTSKEGE